MTKLAKFLRLLGHCVPPGFPRGTAIGNRLLKPLYGSVIGCGPEIVEVWPPIVMELNPCDAIGGNLFFCPQLYDRRERDWIVQCLPANGVFVDLGANIGAYTLWAARRLSDAGTVLAVEADPETFLVLRRNVERNRPACRTIFENVGVADRTGVMSFYRNTLGNRGASSFLGRDSASASLPLPVKRLYDVLQHHHLEHIDFMKMDLEGLELAVLEAFFQDCRAGNDALLPRFLLLETAEGPMANSPEHDRALRHLLDQCRYLPVARGKNDLYRRAPWRPSFAPVPEGRAEQNRA